MAVQTTTGDNNKQEVLIRDNNFIRAIYTGTRIESKILLHAMYTAQRTHNLTTKYSTSEVVEAIGLAGCKDTSVILHQIVPRILRHIVIIRNDNGKTKSTEGFNIVSYCKYEDGIFTIELNKRVLPYLIDIDNPYTAMKIEDLMSFNSTKKTKNFAIRLYEILKTKQYLLKVMDCVTDYYTLADLKIRTGLINVDTERALDIIEKYDLTEEAIVRMGGEPYQEWRNFRRRILEPAIEEINAMSAFAVSYDTKKAANGKIVGIIFKIRKKPGAAKETVDAAYNEAVEATGTLCDVRAVQETAAESVDPVTEIRSFLKEDLTDDELMSLFLTADENVERIKAAYDLACSQRGEIYSLMSWMTNAIKGRWADQPVVSRPGAGSGHGGNCGGWRGQDSHERRFGFKANEYDFDALEEELERQAFADLEDGEKYAVPAI